jgi:hypothetical protein
VEAEGVMAFEELKEKQSVMWGNGPYDRISQELASGHDHSAAGDGAG